MNKENDVEKVIDKKETYNEGIRKAMRVMLL